MKKLLFLFATIVAISFASCGNKTNNKATETCDSVKVCCKSNDCKKETCTQSEGCDKHEGCKKAAE